MSAVAFQNVEKRFDAVVALRALDLDVPDHTFLALLGPSGCGKTTALRILAGLEQPTGGRVMIGERDVTRLQPRDRDVAMVFQSYALYPHMTVAENIAYPLRIRNVPPDEQRDARRRSRRGARGRSPARSAGRGSFPAASASASRWPARSSATPRPS